MSMYGFLDDMKDQIFHQTAWNLTTQMKNFLPSLA